MRVAIRKIAGRYAVLVPRRKLRRAGIDQEADLTVEGEAFVLRKCARPPRRGWAAAAQKLAKLHDDAPVTEEFRNHGDTESSW